MKKCLKTILTIILAFACALSVQVTAFAAPDNPFDFGNINLDDWKEYLQSIWPSTTTTVPAETTTGSNTNNPGETTTQNPVSNTGSGQISTTEPPTKYPVVDPNNGGQANEEPTATVTTTLPIGEEGSTSYGGSLSDLLEDDSAAIIIQKPSDPFTLNGGFVVNGGNVDNSLSWQQIALIAAAVLFVILIALVVALLVQRKKRLKEEEEEEKRRRNNASSGSGSAGTVPVEVMTPERIAELLGAGAAARASSTGVYSANTDAFNMSAEDSAAAIKAAILMGQFSTAYADPLIRKYTDDPSSVSPVAGVDLNGDITGAQILQATDSMLDDIIGNEKYASDISGVHLSNDGIEDLLGGSSSATPTTDATPVTDTVPPTDSAPSADAATIACPECGAKVPADEIFCPECGAYL